MPVSYVDSTSTGASDAQDSGKNVAVPTGAAINDIAILPIEIWLDTATDPIVGRPSGFTQKTFYESTTDGFQRVAIGWKRLTAADTGNYTYTITNGTYWNQAQCILVRGCITTGDPFEDVDTVQNIGTSLPAASVDTTVNPFLLSVIANENSATKTPPTSFTEVEDANYLETSYRIPGSSGTFTTSGGSTSVSTLKLHVLMALKEASGSATNLVIQDSTSATSVDNLSLTRIIDLAIQKAVQATSTDNVSLSQIHQLAIFDSVHATVADNMILATGTSLIIQKAIQATSADGVALTQIHTLQIQDARHTTTADLIQLVLPGFGGFMSVSDVQLQKLQVATGKTGTMADLEFAYYSGLSGLTPVASFSVTDHQRAYWQAQTGLTNVSMADLEKAFYDGLLIAAGSLADREFTYWTSL